MAKKDKAEMPTKPQKQEFKYTVADAAEAAGIQEASVRVALRASEFEREGSRWGWNTKADFDAVVKYLKSRGENAPATKTEKPKAEKKAGKAKKAKAE